MGANLLFGRGCRFAPSLIAVAGFGGGFLCPEPASIVTFSSTLAFASINMSKGWRKSAASAPLFREDAESAQLADAFRRAPACQIDLVGLLMILDQPKHPALFGAPLARLAAKEGHLNPPAQLILVECFAIRF